MTLDAAFNSLRMSWDAPYRFLASLLTVGCLCVLNGWVEASSPLDALGQVATYLGVDAGSQIVTSIADWLGARSDVVKVAALFLVLVGVAFNQGDGRNEGMLPGPWRGAPTALIALAVYWQVNPQGVPLLLTVVSLGTLIVGGLMHLKNAEGGMWLAFSLLNFVTSAVFILVLPLWMISRSRPQLQQSEQG